MFLPDLVVRSRRVVTPRGIRSAAIHIRSSRIMGVLDFDDIPAGCMVDEAGDCSVLPGVVDPIVRVCGRGQAASDAFECTTRAAAAGGVTTIVAMPCDGGLPATSAAALDSTRRSAQGRCVVDVGFWGGVVPGNHAELEPLLAAGVLGFGCAFVSSAENACSPVSEADLRAAMPTLARLGAPLVARAELPHPIAATSEQPRRRWIDRFGAFSASPSRYSTYLRSRPKAVETEAVTLLIQLCRESRVPIHIAALSSSDALTPIFHARSARLPIAATTCPHYLFFVADEVPDGAVEYKCAPPIRERENREFLWGALGGGLIQSIASDHRPARASHGKRNFMEAADGIASLQFSLSSVWTEANARGYPLEQVAFWMCKAPAQLAGLDRKGSIDVGYDADLVVFDSAAEFTVETATMVPPACVTPYQGCRLRGLVRRTYLRGARVYEHGGTFHERCGELLFRRQTRHEHERP